MLAKPPVRKLAKDLGVDLDAVTATGAGGIITRSDVEARALRARHRTGDAARWLARPTGALRARDAMPVKGVRKMTAAGHGAVGVHGAARHRVDHRRRHQDHGAGRELKRDREFRDVKVTPLLVAGQGAVLAIARNPGMNAVWDEAAQEIVVKRYVNLGIAAATPRGLLVPNIKDAHCMTDARAGGASAT